MFDDPESGTDTIVIRKASLADHGTEEGWSDGYGDERATFVGLRFETDHFQDTNWVSLLEGQTARLQRT